MRECTVPEFSVPPAVTTADPTNLTDMGWDNAENYPNSVQFVRRMPIDGSPGGNGADTTKGWMDVTCRQFRDEVVGVARGVVAAGIEPGMRVGLLSRTRDQWTVGAYAISAAGRVKRAM